MTHEAMAATAEKAAAVPRRRHALGLPEGSIRALLALVIFATLWARVLWKPELEVPDYLRDVLFIILGHYFVARRGPSPSAPPTGAAPLYLPRGSIRIVIFAGFAAVAVALYRSGHLLHPATNPAVFTLMLVAGFLLGVLLARLADWWRRGGRVVPRWVDDLQAIVAILAAIGLILPIWHAFHPILIPRDPAHLAKMGLKFGSYGPEHLFGAIVGFYFGNRS